MKVTLLSATPNVKNTLTDSPLGIQGVANDLFNGLLDLAERMHLIRNFFLLALVVITPKLVVAQTATQTFSTPGTFTFTVPPQVTQLTVQAWGGGGGGRGDGTQSTGGGGGGAYASGVVTVTPGQVINLTVGAGGVATSNPGQSGQASIFGANNVVAAGGTGGTNNGGAGGSIDASVGTSRIAGGTGGNRDQSLLGLLAGSGGGGGGSATTTTTGGNGANGSGNTGGNGGTGTGNGGKGGDNLGNGANGVAPGGGGGGKGAEGLLSQTLAGRGASGRIIVSWVSPQTDLQLTMAGPSGQTTVGKSVTFTITLTNGGPNQAFGTEVTALLPAGITFISASTTSGKYNKTTGLWSVGTMNNAQVVTLTITGVLNPTNAYQFSATATAIQPDPNTNNNTASNTPNVCRAGDVSPAFF